MDLPKRETARLRFGRFSKPDSSYFITLCTKNRIRVLTDPTQGNRMIEVLQTMHVTGDINLMASTIMPDHLHLLLALGQRLRVGQVMAKIKSLSRHLGHVPWHWQDDGFEHQLRPNESVDDYGFYIFMNPYRAGVCRLSHKWPWWLCPEPRHFGFLSHLKSDASVPPEWIGMRDEIANRITVCG